MLRLEENPRILDFRVKKPFVFKGQILRKRPFLQPRYHGHYQTSGHVWQGRFKAFPIEGDSHLLAVLRYIERNPLRAGLVARAQDWLWSSLRERSQARADGFVDPGPVALPEGWVEWVNQPQTDGELERLRASVNRGVLYGSGGSKGVASLPLTLAGRLLRLGQMSR